MCVDTKILNIHSVRKISKAALGNLEQFFEIKNND